MTEVWNNVWNELAIQSHMCILWLTPSGRPYRRGKEMIKYILWKLVKRLTTNKEIYKFLL